MTDSKIEKFLEELTELTRKHGLYIQGCGCCGSPAIRKITDEEIGPYFCKEAPDEELTYLSTWDALPNYRGR